MNCQYYSAETKGEEGDDRQYKPAGHKKGKNR